jgi:acetyl esterase/lipase
MTVAILRLVLAVLLFLLSLMVVVPATDIALWYVVILVTELGHWFSLASMGLFYWEFLSPRRSFHYVTLLLCVISTGLFLKPIVQATLIARKLPGELAAAFGPPDAAASLPVPIRWTKLFGLTPLPTAREQDLTFTTSDGSALPLVVYSDGAPGPQPCIVIIHGGGWNSGEPRQLAWWSRMLAARGYRVASIGYRLAPKFHWPAPREDADAALAYLKSHAAELGIDATRFVILGRSAGGQIALDVAYRGHDPAIRGCIASYPPTDMNFSYWTGGEHDILGSRPLIRNFMGGPPASDPALYHDASPLDFVGPDTPPTLLIHGGRDEIVWVRHSERLRARLVEAGRPEFLLELPWATHGFDFVGRGPGAQLELYAMAWFLNSVFRR